MKLKDARILIVDDDADVLTAMRLLFKSKVKEVVTEKKPDHILSLLRRSKFDIIILDMNFNGLVNTGNEGLFWLRRIRETDDKADVILITAYGAIDLAIRSLKEGASDFLVKPWKNEKIVRAVQDVLDRKKSRKKGVRPPGVSEGRILGESEVMKDVFVKLRKVAPTDANVLILGENGTGKDLIARALHDNSLRKDKPFVKVDLGALTPTLFESELFGHRKGAFTDAREDRMGRFEAASGGTLFLDEIGNISLQQQARLLTVLQNRYITPLGSNEQIPVDIRLICATNTGLPALADESRFRKDLVYRVNTVEITVPPLRDRGKDIRMLAEHFIQVYAEKYMKEPFEMDSSFINRLKEYRFPGNVRELQYALERAVIMADNDVLYGDDLVFSPIEQYQRPEVPDTHNLEDVEKTTILKVIEKNNGNISRSARELGITRAALYRRLHKYDL
ncbi:sigma-54-dependent transcriptional regulator [Sinomicrobium soli]|uniref:sigma-54-dependent transcriptional regulator n=1 Tax=Sinomicrobium sp. N-1-3-6 TaxID=2219864 RepID=UPI000DCF3EC6|nr:sigma-54 dependent transcriptional regulator [Sinomicrobium sp. N-1-3-6]RAV30632.1 sigma-54-dependent Fis family transcriptional regulator [Sinomicrobium sp. N-1-3-6]